MIIPMSATIANSGCLSAAWTKAYAQAYKYQEQLSQRYDGEWFKVIPVATDDTEKTFVYVAYDALGLKFDPNSDNYTYLKYKDSLSKWLTKLYKRHSDCSDILKGYSYDSGVDLNSPAFSEHHLSTRSMRNAMKEHHFYKIAFSEVGYPAKIVTEELLRLFRCMSAETGFKHIAVTLSIHEHSYCFTSDMSKNYIDSVLEEALQ